MQLVIDDGGRAAAGYKSKNVGDCAVRAIAIAAGKPYQEVYDGLNGLAKTERVKKREREQKDRRPSSARNGVYRATYERYLKSLGAVWTPTMGIGTGCRVHLRPEELPSGRLVCSLSRHLVAVIDGVLHDVCDCSRDGTRCVYGIYKL